jgi:hypothetical protein
VMPSCLRTMLERDYCSDRRISPMVRVKGADGGYFH